MDEGMYQVWSNRPNYDIQNNEQVGRWGLVGSYCDLAQATSQYCVCVKQYGKVNTMLTQDISPDFDIVLKEGVE